MHVASHFMVLCSAGA